MKKILLSLMTICAFVIVKAQNSTTCGAGAIYHWTDAIPNTVTGNQGSSPAPITINGTSADWEQYITGPFAYAGTPKGGLETDPYTSPIAPANVQKDGLKDAAAATANYDRDAVGQDHRDLRYFAFTYDLQNIFFFFRRPKNNTAQVTLYYFIDINVDGYMKNGEPVIQVTFNNSGSSVAMGYYQTGLPNGYPASALDPVKGNIMTAPIARAKTNNTSEWEVGAADGWNMPGSFVPLSNALLPATVAGEVFNSATLTDTHPDGTVAGYGVEFAVPWKFLRMYNAQGSAGSPLTYQSVFTWHVSLVSGNSGINGAEDNAGGCCAGLAVSAPPSVTPTATFVGKPGGIPPFDYRLNISYLENTGASELITTSQIVVKNPKDANGVDIPAANVQAWLLTGYVDASCNGTAGTSIAFAYNSALSITPNEYVFTPSNPITTVATVAGNGTACYFIDFNTQPGGYPALKSATIDFTYTLEFNISSTNCTILQSGGSTGSLGVLPVKFTTFNAVRNGSNVNLTWQTSSEDNNTGFEVQRFTGSALGWEKVGFVATQAVNGTSSSALNYQFTDINNSKGITQYRLKQVDRDNRSAYSVIRSVRGDGQKGKTIVYPNPSSDGKVNIMFEDANGIRDISLMDMSGRVIKQMRGVTNNNVVIDNLTAGFYTVRIVNNTTGEQVVEKFVVNKR